jgi:hypothetical protein
MTDTTNKDKKTSLYNKSISFFKYILSVFILLLLVFFAGTTLLYNSKIAQSNILPNDIDCAPYTHTEPKIKEIPININTFFDKTKNEFLSQKITFNYTNAIDDYLLEQLKKINESPTQSSFILFFTSIFQELVAANYNINQTIFNTLNGGLPEWVILFLMPLLFPFLETCILLINWFIFSYQWFAKLSWLFKKNANTDKTKLPKWEDVSMLEPVNYGLSIFLAFCFIMLYFVVLFVPIPIVSGLSIFVMTWVFFKPLFIKGIVEGKKYGFQNLFSDTLLYKNNILMHVFTILFVIGAFSSFGNIVGFVSILIYLLFYFKWIPIPIFNKNLPNSDSLNILSSYKMATKTCIVEPTHSASFASSIFKNLGIMNGGGSGVNNIKKYTKMLQKLI